MTRMNCILSLLLCTLMATGCEKPEPAPDPEPIVNPDPETPADPRDIPNDDGVLRVLAIGNSFSADAKFEDGLQDERWDYISLQQGGGRHFQHPRTQSVQTLKNSTKLSILD